ncbi:hypothetical protein BSPA111_25370 [Buttiauxella sp. A111]|nr:hypothetical protein BSPA111_25370 [Buttiauxella sp. A111]
MVSRLQPNRAFWLNGYQAEALYNNVAHVRAPVEDLARPTTRNTTYSFAAFRRAGKTDTTTEGNNDVQEFI